MHQSQIRIATIIAGLLCTANLSASQVLSPCPDSPNCVSSHASDSGHFVEPIRAGNSREQALVSLSQVLSDLPRVTWHASSPGQIHAEFASAVFGFVDDVVFLIEEDGLIQVRSASRTGYWDFGENRRRVERLRKRLAP